MEIYIVVTDVVYDVCYVRITAKVLIHVCSYDFYDTTLSTGKQRRHMITQFYYIKVGFKGTFIARTCFPGEILR